MPLRRSRTVQKEQKDIFDKKRKKVQSLSNNLKRTSLKLVPRKQSNFLSKYIPRRVKRPTQNYLSPQGVMRNRQLRKSYEERTSYF